MAQMVEGLLSKYKSPRSVHNTEEKKKKLGKK
jgi:hypothetical protein